MKYPSYLNYYWRLWIGMVGCLLLLRWSFFLGANDNILFVLFAAYAVLVWGTVCALNLFENRRMMNYLKEFHREKCEQLLGVTFLRNYGLSGVKALQFIFSDDDLGDEEISVIKRERKRFIAFALTVLFSMIPLSVMVTIAL